MCPVSHRGRRTKASFTQDMLERVLEQGPLDVTLTSAAMVSRAWPRLHSSGSSSSFRWITARGTCSHYAHLPSLAQICMSALAHHAVDPFSHSRALRLDLIPSLPSPTRIPMDMDPRTYLTLHHSLANNTNHLVHVVGGYGPRTGWGLFCLIKPPQASLHPYLSRIRPHLQQTPCCGRVAATISSLRAQDSLRP